MTTRVVAPKIAPGGWGSYEIYISSDEVRERGATFSISAPRHSTFSGPNGAYVWWAFPNNPGGTMNATISPDKKTMTVVNPSFEMASPGRDLKLSFEMRADALQPVTGVVDGGFLTVQSGSAMPSDLKVPISFVTTANAPVTVTTPANGALIRDARPEFSGTGYPGAAIELLDADGELLAPATVVGADGIWRIAPSNALQQGPIVGSINQIVENSASSVSYEFTYREVQAVAVTSPELDGEVAVARPVITGTGEPGAKVTVTGFVGREDRTVLEATVNDDGVWSGQISYTLPRGSMLDFTATQVFEGATTVAAVRFSYGAVVRVVDVTLTAPVKDATLTDARPVFSGTGENGAAIEIVEAGKTVASATVADGKWSATPTADVALGAHAGLVNQKINGVIQSSTLFSFTRESAAAPLKPLVVQTPAIGGTIVTGPNGTVAPTFSGTATPGAEVKIVTAWGDNVGTVTADATTGAWSITWNKALLPNSYAGGATIQTVDGKVIDRVGYKFTVAGSTVQKPLVVEAPAIGGEFMVGASGTVAPVFSGTATPGADIKVVTAWGDTVGTVKADATTGAWSITWNKSLLPNRYVGGNTIQTINGVEIDRTGYDFMVKSAAVDVAVTSPAMNGTIYTGDAAEIAPTFTGTGTEGARIEIVGAWGTDLGKGVVKDGVWEITWKNTYKPSTYSGGFVKQYLQGETEVHSQQGYSFTVTAGNPAL